MREHRHSFRCAREGLGTGFGTGVLSWVSPHFESSGCSTCQVNFSPASLDSLFSQPNPKSNSLTYEVLCISESNFPASWLRWHRQGQSINIIASLQCPLYYYLAPRGLRSQLGCQNPPKTTQTELAYPSYTVWILAEELMAKNPPCKSSLKSDWTLETFYNTLIFTHHNKESPENRQKHFLILKALGHRRKYVKHIFMANRDKIPISV